MTIQIGHALIQETRNARAELIEKVRILRGDEDVGLDDQNRCAEVLSSLPKCVSRKIKLQRGVYKKINQEDTKVLEKLQSSNSLGA